MSSWLGGLGSGLGQVGGSLSSFTGQISTFTKDMLLEGVEEVGDAATELQVSNSKLMQVETAFTAQRSEHERLKKLHVELEEKLEASEIQNKQQSTEYRNQLQQRDVEISHLKARQSGLQDEIQTLQHSSHVAMLPLTTSSSTVPTTTSSSSSSSSFMPHTVGGHHGFHGDEMDLSDVMWSQQEINRLATEVARLEAELSHWRRVAQASNSTGSGNGDQADGLQLQRTIEDLREQMSREVDEHQHEMAALQDAQRHKMADFSRRHREELAEYEERIEELEEQLHTGERSQPSSPSSTSQPDVQSTSLQRDSQLEELRASLQEAQSSRGLLQRQREEAQEENAELLQNYSRLQASVAELQARVQEQEDRAVHRAQMESEIQGLRKALAGAEQELERLQGLPEAAPREEVEHADILELNTVIGSLREEKERLEQDKRSLQASLEASEARGGGGGEGLGEHLGLEELQEELGRRAKRLLEAQEERETLLAELEELDGQNQEATQHMISVKEQLSGQLQESQEEVSRLTSDLTALREKLSQSAFTLNDLHMGNRTLEDTVKELRGRLGRAQEQAQEARSEASELRRSLEERPDRTGERGDQGEGEGERAEREVGLRAELLEKEKELAELRSELGEARSSREEAISENYEMKETLGQRRLQEEEEEEEEEAAGKVGELGRQLRDGQASLSRTVLEKDTRIEALKLEKSQLEGELSRAEGELAGRARRYQQTIEELSRARSLDATALQTEHERAVRLNQDKEQEIAQLRRDVEQMAADHRDTNEMLSITVAGQEQLTDLLQEKDSFMDTLKQNAAELQRELEAKAEEVSREARALRQALEERDRHLGVMKEDNSHLREEIDRLRDQQSRPQPHTEPRTLDIITELETEIHQLKAARDRLEDETHALRRAAEEQQASLLLAQQSLLAQQGELEQARARQEQTLQNYNRHLQARDEEVARLQQAVDGLGGPPPPAPQDQGEVILRQDKDDQSLNGGESGNEKHDLSKVEIQRLVQGIQEKESEIHQLSERNVSLARQLDQLALSRDEAGKLAQMVRQKDLELQALHARVAAGQDVLYLQQQLQAYALEREQVLSVLNEKTRENSQLRSDYHRLVDIVSGKEAALLQLRQENTRLADMSDPSGSQEMFRETIQNLSRIIREKDIEIDALTQKCQTLVAVLQASAGPGPGAGGGGGSWAGGCGVSSNQFEELLQERDTLKQQVKKVEEWKQQVITTVKNLQHESAQMHEELLTLQGKVSADSDCSSQLSVDYARLIQSYELKERRLGSLGQELAQVQQSISQLSSTKDVLLGKLDSVVPEVAAVAGQLAQAGEALLSMEPLAPVQRGAAPAPSAGGLQQLQAEVRSLRAALAERDAAVRTLQESALRLSASEGDQRGLRAEEEARRARERLETLQHAAREKDLLIKSKGDQLAQASEALRSRESDSELLRQAVTNLKERALILELDGRSLKEENEAVATRSREKESEFRALQETNMQVSFLLREKEFQLTSMSEKAATLEKMLKDKDQGNSGELNQLLNEMRSMQEKAVLFQQERDQVMLALKQKQMETTAVHTELQRVKDKEARLNVELERLRSHLLEMEDSYTRDALAAEDREVELRRRVALLDQRLASSSSAVENASVQAGLQVESLQEQLGAAVRQRDEAQMKLHTSQEQVKQYAQSLSNLQIVLEQFQQEEKSMYSSELDKLRREREAQRSRAERLEDQASALQMNLDEANSALESASRLTDQLDLNEEQMEDLRKQVELRQEMLEEAQTKLMELLNSTEGKVDKQLMRNLFLGYFHTPRNKRAEVLRLMGNVLGLSREDVDKMLEEDGRPGVTGWVSSWLGGRGPYSVPSTPPRPGPGQTLNSSFSEMFVKFLEVESSTDRPPPRMPVQDMKALGAPPPGRGASSSSGLAKRPPDSNPFLAPRSAAVPLLGAGVPGGPGGAGGHLLMKPISEALPSFTPVPVSSEASGLKDLLRQ
ncbi:thyroid receptor-interacting protein 11 isoform X2 [Gadus chalcogrammus]|uniref:thyroid receptor-interacting protein 11 isoform X2 n=1 Tax=Gadus chalcogrammus TaxID=1042646 RepID=UPI0024C3742E|nr:thyroid receptor-interacting protein 11 isoform X2 [Gadus chalcogrammus]